MFCNIWDSQVSFDQNCCKEPEAQNYIYNKTYEINIVEIPFKTKSAKQKYPKCLVLKRGLKETERAVIR